MIYLKKNKKRKKMGNINSLGGWYVRGNREQAKVEEYDQVAGECWWISNYLQYNRPLKKYIAYCNKRRL